MKCHCTVATPRCHHFKHCIQLCQYKTCQPAPVYPLSLPIQPLQEQKQPHILEATAGVSSTNRHAISHSTMNHFYGTLTRQFRPLELGTQPGGCHKISNTNHVLQQSCTFIYIVSGAVLCNQNLPHLMGKPCLSFPPAEDVLHVSVASTLAGGGVYRPAAISTLLFALDSRDLRFAAVFLCSVPLLLALSISLNASEMSLSTGASSSTDFGGLVAKRSNACRTWSTAIGNLIGDWVWLVVPGEGMRKQGQCGLVAAPAWNVHQFCRQ